MEAKRRRKVTVSLSPEDYARLLGYARKRRWKPSFAAAVLVEQGLGGGSATTGTDGGTPG